MTSWIEIAFILTFGVLISLLAGQVISRLIKKALKTTAHGFTKPIALGIGSWFVVLAAYRVHLNPTLLTNMILGARTITYVGLVWTGWSSAQMLEDYFMSRPIPKGGHKLNTLLAPLVNKLVKALVIIFGVLSMAEVLHFPITSLLTGLGIGGIAIAMAAKETIANVFGSITVLVDRPFQIGDWIKIGDTEGTVESIGFRSTKLRTFYDSMVTIPNATLLTANVDNMGARKYRRAKVLLRMGYYTPSGSIQTFREAVLDHMKGNTVIRKDGMDIHIDDFGPTGVHVNISCYFQVATTTEENEQKHQLLSFALNKIQELKIELNLPTNA